MFLAGEIASVVLHQDLGLEDPPRQTRSRVRYRSPRWDAEAFPGWAVLQDLEGRTEGTRPAEDREPFSGGPGPQEARGGRTGVDADSMNQQIQGSEESWSRRR